VKKSQFKFALAAFAIAAAATGPGLAQIVPGGEPVCGYATATRQLRATDVRQGLTVQWLGGDATAGELAPLRFRVVRQPQDEPVDELQVEHEKLMHVIGVREDLAEFVHVHPTRVAPGLWQVNHAFAQPGRYQFWTDIKHRGVVYSFEQPRIKVAGGNPGPVGLTPTAAELADRVSGFEVTLQPDRELVSGETNRLQVIIRNREGTQIGTEFFLGALLHVVIVKEDLSVYAHGHAESHLKGERDIYFQHVFPQRGMYRVFAQFRPAKTALAPDQALLARFWVRVKRGAGAGTSSQTTP
jgi:hypothetical protein